MEHGRIISRRPGLTVAEFSGTPYEIGLSHGRLFAAEIAHMRGRLFAYLSAISFGIGGRLLAWLFGTLSRRMELHTPEHIREEIRGMAEGSGQSYRFMFLLNSLDDVLVNMACSAVALEPGRAGGGRLIVGRNLDYPLFYDVLPGLTTVFRVVPDSGLPFVSVGWPGFAAVVTGMNNAGITVADLTSISRDRRLTGTPALILNRLALQGSSSLDDMEDTYRRARRTVGKNVMAASPDEARVLEMTANELAARKPGLGYICCTNHFETPSLAARQGSVKPPPRTDFPASYYSYAFSRERMETLSALLDTGDKPGVNEVASALGAEPVANLSTVQSVVFVPETRRIFVAVSGNTPVSAGEHIEISGLI